MNYQGAAGNGENQRYFALLKAVLHYCTGSTEKREVSVIHRGVIMKQYVDSIRALRTEYSEYN
jgi:hypothetical protein